MKFSVPRVRVIGKNGRTVVENGSGRMWTCFGPGRSCFRFVGDECVCGGHLEGHDAGDEDRS